MPEQFFIIVSYLYCIKYDFWFIGRVGDIGPKGFRGLDGQKGMQGDNGTTSIGLPGVKGTIIIQLNIRYKI